MPTSAACSATASLTPSPRKATSTPVRRVDLDDARLLVRAHPGEHVRRWHAAASAVVVHCLDLRTCQHAARLDADLSADCRGHRTVVAGDDLDLDAEGVQPGDRRPCARLRLVDEGQEAGEMRSRSSSGAAWPAPDAARVPTATTRAPAAKRPSSVRVAAARDARRNAPAPLQARPWSRAPLSRPDPRPGPKPAAARGRTAARRAVYTRTGRLIAARAQHPRDSPRVPDRGCCRPRVRRRRPTPRCIRDRAATECSTRLHRPPAHDRR